MGSGGDPINSTGRRTRPGPRAFTEPQTYTAGRLHAAHHRELRVLLPESEGLFLRGSASRPASAFGLPPCYASDGLSDAPLYGSCHRFKLVGHRPELLILPAAPAPAAGPLRASLSEAQGSLSMTPPSCRLPPAQHPACRTVRIGHPLLSSVSFFLCLFFFWPGWRRSGFSASSFWLFGREEARVTFPLQTSIFSQRQRHVSDAGRAQDTELLL